MFCGCSGDHFGKKPNSQTCPVCLGLPGALPVPNHQAIDWALMIGLALNCQVNLESTFDRKHYFYPDLPKGYQISQFDDPFCQQGFLDLDSGKKIRINRVHLEEDTAKMQHRLVKGKKITLVDFNRSGVPLVEIVTEPDISNGQEAKEFLKKLRGIIRSLQVSDCDMEKGSMRLEPNISWSQSLINLAKYKVEIKNLNSFRFAEQSIDYELKRQKSLLDHGQTPIQETRGFNAKLKRTYSQRIKETSADYRYFPEPDIPPIVFTKEYIENLRQKLPKLPAQMIQELINNFHLNTHTAQLLVKDAAKLAYFKKYLPKIEPTVLANLIINKKINLDKPPQLKAVTQP
ncbi:MAG: Asp-tRNA(Asn)/Glu-tRNA(Gln) amidotransferase subunit GatB, partial [Patescibacteria group bacterium]|nr:Asp-tRNA(Asn)/Glu-tRNA(Gln) amidotransferase subunit GatB [Patescibacteria group bacterium]